MSLSVFDSNSHWWNFLAISEYQRNVPNNKSRVSRELGKALRVVSFVFICLFYQ